MRRRGLRRFVLEVLFLAGVAVAVTVAELRPAGVIALMAIAWIVVALLEWTAWLDEPHYGRGLPPRYYVPQVALPPSQAVEQGGVHHPVLTRPPALPPAHAAVPAPALDEEPTLETPASEWGAELGEWPVLDTSASEDTMIAGPDEIEEEPPSVIVPLPPVVALDETVEHAFAVAEEPEVEVGAEPEPAAIPVAAAAAGLAVEEPAGPETELVPRPPVTLPAPVRLDRSTRHRIDPTATSTRRRRWFRRAGDEVTVEVADGPPPDRVLPARVVEQVPEARR